ncbi:MAG: hypothetical protein ACJ8AW_14590 [Rhodopila sp.]
MGVVAAAFGMGLATGGLATGGLATGGLAMGDTGVALAVAFYGLHHTLVKGGLFLGVGLAPRAGEGRARLVLVPAAIIALGMAGLPLSGGFLAKLAIKPVLGSGLAGLLGSVSSATTALLMTHFLFRVAALPQAAPAAVPGRALRWPWLVVAAASVLVPWGLYPTVMGGSISYALSVSSLWSSLWPVLVGGELGLALRRWGGGGAGVRDSDIVVPMSARVDRVMIGFAAAVERLDVVLREWPVAMLSLVAVALAALMLASV